MSLYYGIDVSDFQGDIDFKKVKAAGKDFVMIKAGEGLAENSKFKTNITNAAAAGLKVGVYWFAKPLSIADAIAEANKCLDVIKYYDISMPVAYDFEDYSIYYAKGKGVFYIDYGVPNRDKITNIINAFCKVIKEAGYIPAVYTNTNYIKNYLYIDKIDAELWQAAWGKADPPIANYSNEMAMWQYGIKGSAAQVSKGEATIVGSVSGINAAIDLDVCYKDYPVIKAKAQLVTEPAVTYKYKTGEMITFKGTKQYKSSNATTSFSATPCTAKIIGLSRGAKHPYSIKNDELKVYGWVDADDLADYVAPPKNNQTKTNPNFVVGKTKVKVKSGALNYDTKKPLASFVYQMTFDVIESVGDRIVIGLNGVVTAPVNANDLTVVFGGTTTPSESAIQCEHKVKTGDTLWSLAEKYLGNGLRYTEIKKLNNMTQDYIFAGQVLKIPKK